MYMTGEKRTGNESAGIPDAEKNGAIRPFEAFVTAMETCMNRGYRAVVVRLNELAAFKAGLSTPRVWDATATTRLMYDPATETMRRVDMSGDRNRSQLISDEALFQVFSNPAVQPDKKNNGYAAATELGSWLTEGRSKSDQRRRASQEDAEEFATAYGGSPEDYIGLVCEGSSDDKIFEEIKKREAGIMAREALHAAYDYYVSTAGDEAAGADMALAFKDKPLQLIDIQEIMHDGTGHHHDALMHFIAAGKSMDQLIKEGHEDLAIEGIHFTKGANGVVKVGHKNPYANDEGWTTESFNNLIKPILRKTDGDLLSVYESWLMFLSFGCASKLGIDKKNDGRVSFAGANISSAMLKEIYHFTYIIRGEAGYSWDGKNRLEVSTHRGKTGPLATVLDYPDLTEAPYNLGTFLESVNIKLKDREGNMREDANGEEIKITLMDAIWNTKGAELNSGKNFRLDEISLFPVDDGSLADQGDGGGSDDVLATGAYNVWLLKARNVHVLLAAAIEAVKGGAKGFGSDFTDKLARNANKGLTAAWKMLPAPLTEQEKKETDPKKKKKDKRTELINKASKEGWGGAAPKIIFEADPRDPKKQIEIIQMYPNEKDVRYIMAKGWIRKYLPGHVVNVGGAFDTSADPEDRFSTVAIRTTDIPGKKHYYPGAPMEIFLTALVDSSFLRKAQVLDLIKETLDEEAIKFLKQGDRLKNTLFK